MDEAVRAYLSTGRKYYATDAAVRSAVRSMPFYLNGRPHQRKLVLQWLEESYASKEPIKLDALTVEHVLPQTPTPQWQQMLSEDLGPDETFAEVHESPVHTLGNLTLTGYNSELSNSSFAVKRTRLARSGLALNREIADRDRWGRPEIQARADALAERIIGTWPGPTAAGADTRAEGLWDVMNRALAELPAGSWTTYGDVAALIGTAPMPVGARLASHPVPNAHRVLQVGGTISASFRWPDPERTDDPRDILAAEGVEFDRYGRANPAQRIVTEELAQLIGMTPEELPRPRADRDARFAEQLAELQRPEVAEATRAVLAAWTELGGTLGYGTGSETSCFLLARGTDHRLGAIWPVTIYPSGRVEVVFQYLGTRAPFDDSTLREEFRQRLNTVPGVEIATAKLALRPGFPLTVLVDPGARKALVEHLGWFHAQAQADDPDR